MDINSKNKAYYDTISSISNQLNEFFTKKGWQTLIDNTKFFGVYYYHLNKLDEFGLELNDYNKFTILVPEKYSVNYINNESDLIIINNKFSIILNNINVNVFILDDTPPNFENNIISLNNINVLHNNSFEYRQNCIINNLNSRQLQLNSKNIDYMINFHQAVEYAFRVFKMFNLVNTLMNEHYPHDTIDSASTYTVQQPVPIVPKDEGGLSVLLDAIDFINSQDYINSQCITELPLKGK
jgi:hypothetical protein